eukprot:10362372-Karenia_brevis.AAC.1
MHAKAHSQFGPRVHLDPKSDGGKAHMHDRSGGWCSSCDEQVGWGVPLSLSRSSSVDFKSDGSPSERALDGNIVTD